MGRIGSELDCSLLARRCGGCAARLGASCCEPAPSKNGGLRSESERLAGDVRMLQAAGSEPAPSAPTEEVNQGRRTKSTPGGMLGLPLSASARVLRHAVRAPSEHSMWSEGRAGAGAGAGAGVALEAGKAGAASKGMAFLPALLLSLNFVVGIPVLSVPYMVSIIGRLGYVILGVTALCQMVTGWFLATIMIREPLIKSYADIALHATRNAGASARTEKAATLGLQVFQGAELFFYTVYGMVLVAFTLLALIPGLSPLAASLITAAVGCLCVGFTLSNLLLTISGVIGIVSMALFILGLVAADIAQIAGESPATVRANWDGYFNALRDAPVVVATYGNLLLLANGHAVWPSIFNALEDRRDSTRIVTWSVVVILLVALVLGPLAIPGFGHEAVAQYDLPTGYLPRTGPVGGLQIFLNVMLLIKIGSSAGIILYPVITELALPLVLATSAAARRCCRDSQAEPKAQLAQAPAQDQEQNQEQPTAAMTALHIIVGCVAVILAVLVGLLMPSIAFVMTISKLTRGAGARSEPARSRLGAAVELGQPDPPWS
jgi:hypothetical protein